MSSFKELEHTILVTNCKEFPILGVCQGGNRRGSLGDKKTENCVMNSW